MLAQLALGEVFRPGFMVFDAADFSFFHRDSPWKDPVAEIARTLRLTPVVARREAGTPGSSSDFMTTG